MTVRRALSLLLDLVVAVFAIAMISLAFGLYLRGPMS